MIKIDEKDQAWERGEREKKERKPTNNRLFLLPLCVKIDYSNDNMSEHHKHDMDLDIMITDITCPICLGIIRDCYAFQEVCIFFDPFFPVFSNYKVIAFIGVYIVSTSLLSRMY